MGYVMCLQEIVCRLTKRLAPSVAVLAFLLLPSSSQAATGTALQTLSVTISPVGGLYSISALALTKAGTVFNNYTGTIATFQYRARATDTTGSGSITVKATTDFSCSGGPCIATPPSPGDALTYTCSGATLGTACSGTQTVSTTASTPVLTLPASACTGGSPCSLNTPDPNTVSLTFALTNNPLYQTGNYSATLTFTISAN